MSGVNEVSSNGISSMESWELILIWAFAFSCGVVLYTYACYPLLIWLASGLLGKRQTPPSLPARQEWPRVSLLVAAYNEETEIGRRIDNALAADYPRDKLEIVIASDGSTDRTCEIVRQYAEQGVRLVAYPERHGKPAVLNRTVPQLQGDLVVFSDANAATEPQAFHKLVRWFQDPRVGAVCGRLVLTDPATGNNADGLYWKYETFLKKCENRLGGLLGSNGAIYAVRREEFPAISDQTIIDDFVIPLQVKAERGSRIVYDEEAVAREQTPASIGAEFQRRSRIGAGGFQAIGMLKGLLHPRFGWTSFTFFNHKILRWLCPFFLAGAFVTNVLLVHVAVFRWLMLGQFTFYLLAMVGSRLPHTKSLRVLRLVTMFVHMNAALAVGFCRWMRGTQKTAWRRTIRLAETVEASQ
jgi:cellulose synthase/poly-beta-1,6-N-acetylglucosamine synthase-like glycosyltransferase